jgi:cell division septation protein DedD
VTRAAAAPAADGPWKVQLGAFSVRGNAERLWAKLSGRSELAGRTRLMVPAGGVTKLQAGGYTSRDTAEAACRSLKRAGQECLVTR